MTLYYYYFAEYLHIYSAYWDSFFHVAAQVAYSGDRSLTFYRDFSLLVVYDWQHDCQRTHNLVRANIDEFSGTVNWFVLAAYNDIMGLY